MAYVTLHPIKQLDFQINLILTCESGKDKSVATEYATNQRRYLWEHLQLFFDWIDD